MIVGMDGSPPSAYAPATWPAHFSALWHTLRTWPWADTWHTMRQRFAEDRLGLTAGSLTFTTMVGLVPLVTVMLALFTAFPMFARFQQALDRYLLQSLVPDGIAKPVLGALTQFAAKASQVGTVGLVVLLVAALALVFTIDRTLNAIWRVRKRRPLAQRVLVYWAALTLGPLAAGRQPEPDLVRDLVLARPGRVDSRRRQRCCWRPSNSACWPAAWQGSTVSHPTPTSDGRMPGRAACSPPSGSSSPSAGWRGTWASFPPIR